ncbi:MAG: aminopeptidase, partial [Hyphomicrobiales bacterium]
RNPLGWWWHTPHDLIDKIDEDFLARDTRVVVATLWRLLADEILPLDHAGHATALLDELKTIAPKLEDRLSVARLVEAAESLRQKAQALASLKAKHDHGKLDRINAALMRVSRALVPLDYTEGDRFSHDPALPQPAWPALQKLRDLAQAKPGSDAAHFLAVAATRARNRLSHGLRQALEALDEALAAANAK